MPSKSIQALAWVDFETTGLPAYGDGIVDFRGVHLLEVAMVVTDLDLDPITGYHEVIHLTTDSPAIAALKANDVTREMHMANGLLRDCLTLESGVTVEEAEAELVKTIEQSSFDRGTIAIAGSGVARFDSPFIRTRMPKLASWLHYAEIDTGNTRRESTLYNHNRPVVNPLPESSRDSAKAHRGWEDIQAHLKEARRYRDFYRKAVEAIEMWEKVNG